MHVILADDQLVIRQALYLLLHTKTPRTIITEVATVDELIAQMQTHEPDLILLDWGMLGEQPAVSLAFFRERWPSISFIVLSSRPDAKAEALQAGAASFISKTSLPDEVLSSIEKLCDDRDDNENQSNFST